MNKFFEDRKIKVETYKKDIRKKLQPVSKVDIPDGLFLKCENCCEYIFHEDIVKNKHVCPKCNFHYRVKARDRIKMVGDNQSFTELFTDVITANPLDFPKYEEKLAKYQKETNETDAFVCGTTTINDCLCAIGALDSYFMMGSMGCVVGEKVTKLAEYAAVHNLPLIIFSASGGARMQEGIFSLMQMAKTSAAIKYHSLQGLLFISVLTNPTTGGVAASFASLGDIIIAEKGSLIGFAGQRVIKQTIKQDLPEGFQTAEFQLKKGFADKVVARNEIKPLIAKLLTIHKKED